MGVPTIFGFRWNLLWPTPRVVETTSSHCISAHPNVSELGISEKAEVLLWQGLAGAGISNRMKQHSSQPPERRKMKRNAFGQSLATSGSKTRKNSLPHTTVSDMRYYLSPDHLCYCPHYNYSLYSRGFLHPPARNASFC